ncbi:MAG: FkbM family methyltransferase [Synergistaceae bacterium]|nr:FkbM family methyltransferase [Synergistaceae bacterium]
MMKYPEANIPECMGHGSLRSKIIRAYRVMHAGLSTPLEFASIFIDRGLKKMFSCNPRFTSRLEARRVFNEFKVAGNVTNEFYRLKDAKFPLLESDNKVGFFSGILQDTFYVYLNLDDDYHEEKINDLFYLLGEGPYGLINDKVNVTVEIGDVVIDAGSWLGDFAAYASAKGAITYAFEPSEDNFAMLLKTAELNKNIIPVKKGLSDETASMDLFLDTHGVTGGGTLRDMSSNTNYETQSSQIETITLDDFVHENNLERVDFIKSDIEGFERKLLAGAQETLRRFAPKLALCTYHLPDDPEVMEALIKQANPKYNVVQKRKKLFASVPK